MRQQQDALGLSLVGLLRNRWTIVDDEPPRTQPADRQPRLGDVKARMRLLTEPGEAS